MNTKNTRRLDKKTQQKLLLELCYCIVSLKNPQEASKLLADLLSTQELMTIAKRLQIAKLLIKEKTYGEIYDEIKVSPTTIAKIHNWLYEAGDGYRLVIERMKNKKYDPPSFNGKTLKNSIFSGNLDIGLRAVKRRYPSYFWPEKLLEELIKSVGQKNKKQFYKVLKNLNRVSFKDRMNKKIGKNYKYSITT